MTGDRPDRGTALYSILLAAGASSRFGSPKQLARVAGRTMLRTALDRATQITSDRVILVLGAHAPELHVALQGFPGVVVANPHWAEGVASSIRFGLAHVPPTCAGIMLMLADQPCVISDDLDNLVNAWQESPQSMAAALYDDILGAPAIFPRHRFPDLSALRGDAGARRLLRSEGDRVLRVSMPNARIDIDTPEDLEQFLGHAPFGGVTG